MFASEDQIYKFNPKRRRGFQDNQKVLNTHEKEENLDKQIVSFSTKMDLLQKIMGIYKDTTAIPEPFKAGYLELKKDVEQSYKDLFVSSGTYPLQILASFGETMTRAGILDSEDKIATRQTKERGGENEQTLVVDLFKQDQEFIKLHYDKLLNKRDPDEDDIEKRDANTVLNAFRKQVQSSGKAVAFVKEKLKEPRLKDPNSVRKKLQKFNMKDYANYQLEESRKQLDLLNRGQDELLALQKKPFDLQSEVDQDKREVDSAGEEIEQSPNIPSEMPSQSPSSLLEESKGDIVDNTMNYTALLERTGAEIGDDKLYTELQSKIIGIDVKDNTTLKTYYNKISPLLDKAQQDQDLRALTLAFTKAIEIYNRKGAAHNTKNDGPYSFDVDQQYIKRQPNTVNWSKSHMENFGTIFDIRQTVIKLDKKIQRGQLFNDPSQDPEGQTLLSETRLAQKK